MMKFVPPHYDRLTGHAAHAELWTITAISMLALQIVLTCQVSAQDTSGVNPVSHPRLFFTAKEIPMLRQQAATTHAQIWNPVQKFSQLALTQIPDIRNLKFLPCDAGDYARQRFGDILIPLAFSYIITGDAAYADAARTALLTYSAWPSWDFDAACNARRGLDARLAAAYLLFSSSIAYDWLYDQLMPEEHATITRALSTHARALYEESAGITHPGDTEASWWRNAFTHHQHIVTMSALGMAALALEGETRHAQTWLEQAVRHAKIHQALLQGIADGSWHEGTMLQTTMLGMSVPFFYNLRKVTGPDYFAHDYYRAFATWMTYNWLPASTRAVISHGDLTWGYPLGQHHAILSFVAREYRNKQARWLIEQLDLAQPRTPKAWHAPWYVFEFLFYDPAVPAAPPDNLPTVRTFPDASGVIWRTGWGDNDLVFGLKTGAQGGRFAHETFIGRQYPWTTNLSIDYDGDGIGFDTRHDHLDTNTFYLWAGNVQLTGELTGDSDAHPMYGQTSVHNTILIDGKGQVRPRDAISSVQGSDGVLETVAVTDHFNYVISDATNRYKIFEIQQADPEKVDAKTETIVMSRVAKRIKRHVLFVKPAYLIMIDDLAAEEVHEYAWVAHFTSRIRRDGNWIRGEPLAYRNDQDDPDAVAPQVLGIYVLNPAPFRLNIGVDDPASLEASDIRTPPGSFTSFAGKPYIRVLPETPVAAVQFAHVLYPTTVQAWSAKPEIQSLGIDADAAGIRVLLNGMQDHLINYGEQADITRAEYALRGKAASVHKDQDGAITALFLADGTVLTDQHGARPLITIDVPATLDVTYDAPWVRISGDVPRGATVTVHSPQWQDVTVNGTYICAIRIGDALQFVTP